MICIRNRHLTSGTMRLDPVEYAHLVRIVRTTKDVRVLRRAQALLDLNAGDSTEIVSKRYQVARSTIYNWITRRETCGLTDQALRDKPRPGRPRLSESRPDKLR